MTCLKECANEGLTFDAETRKMRVNTENCVGCGRCLGACNFDAIEFANFAANELLNKRMAEYRVRLHKGTRSPIGTLVLS